MIRCLSPGLTGEFEHKGMAQLSQIREPAPPTPPLLHRDMGPRLGRHPCRFPSPCVRLMLSASSSVMTKLVRIPQELAGQIEELAHAERRSFANMVQVLLGQALVSDTEPITLKEVKTEPVYIETQVSTTRRAERRDDHFKPDFKTAIK